jgi:hypothetical protein
MTVPNATRQTGPRVWVLLLLLCIVVLAVGLRASRLDLAEFKSDEAGIERAALALVREGKFPAVGPSSSQGPAHPPLQIYLLAIPFAVTQDPRLAVLVVALVHSGAAIVIYLIGARFFDRFAGLIAAFLFAVNPWAIYYARKIWTQNWPLATTLFIFCLLLFVVERRSKALIGVALALVALAGAHLGGIAFLILVVPVLILFRSQIERRWLVIALAILLLFVLPYLYYDATHGWENLRGVFQLGVGKVEIDVDAARFAAWLSSGFHLQDLAGVRHDQFVDSLPALRWLDVLAMILLGVGVLHLVFRVAHDLGRRRAGWKRLVGRDVVILLWLLVPVLLQTRHTQPVYPHYFILLYPVQFLIIGILVSDASVWAQEHLGARWGRWLLAGSVVLLVVIAAWQVYLGRRFVRFVAQYDTPDGYGPVVGPLVKTASVAGDAAFDGAEILVVAQGDNPVWDNLPSAFDVLLPRERPRRFVDGQTGLVFPQHATVYVTTPAVDGESTALSQMPGTALVSEIAAPGEQQYRVFRRENRNRDDVLERLTEIRVPRRFSNGVEFLAYAVDSAGQTDGSVELILAWWLDGPALQDTDYHFFAHLLNATEERVGQNDLAGFPTASWQTGDLVLTRFKIAIDRDAGARELWARLGMYLYPDIVNVPVVDGAGNPISDAVLVGPISLD